MFEIGEPRSATDTRRRRSAQAELLSADHRKLVVETTRARIDEAAQRYRATIEPVPVAFDLFGVCAGMYRVRGKERLIRYNPLIFARYLDENLRDTVPHEVAHHVVDILFGRRGVKPHGHQWRTVMADFGVAPEVRHHWDLDTLAVRRQRRFPYQCSCGEHQLSTVRHKRMMTKSAVYRCLRCGEPLKHVTG
jgi:SprT protein